MGISVEKSSVVWGLWIAARAVLRIIVKVVMLWIAISLSSCPTTIHCSTPFVPVELLNSRYECARSCTSEVNCDPDEFCSCPAEDPIPKQGEELVGACLLPPMLIDRRTACTVESGVVVYVSIAVD
jgi:hypothetical protein